MSRIAQHMKKPWVVMPVVAALAFAGWFVFRQDGDAPATTDQAAATEQVVEATVGAMAKTVSADGTVAAAEAEDLSFGSSGTVTKVLVAAGDQVTAGQVLAEIDSAALAADVSSAEAAVADAEAKLADDTDADASDAQLAADTSSLESANDQLDAANEALDGAQLVATIDGTVATVNVTEGEELASGGTGGVGQTGSASGSGASAGTLGSSSSGLPGISTGASDTDTSSDADISIVSTGRFTVDLGFDDTDIASVEVGQVASVSLSTGSSSTFDFGGGFPSGGFPGGAPSGFPGASVASAGSGDPSADTGEATTTTQPQLTAQDDGIDGFVSEVGTVADASSGVASYPVTVAFADDTGQFNVGATVTVEITYAEVADAVQIPSFAVSSTDGASTVQVKTEGGTETRTVTTGLTAGTMVQITSGLEAGESVVISRPGAGGFGPTVVGAGS